MPDASKVAAAKLIVKLMTEDGEKPPAWALELAAGRSADDEAEPPKQPSPKQSGSAVKVAVARTDGKFNHPATTNHEHRSVLNRIVHGATYPKNATSEQPHPESKYVLVLLGMDGQIVPVNPADPSGSDQVSAFRKALAERDISIEVPDVDLFPGAIFLNPTPDGIVLRESDAKKD